jgi:hypothetical protein
VSNLTNALVVEWKKVPTAIAIGNDASWVTIEDVFRGFPFLAQFGAK